MPATTITSPANQIQSVDANDATAPICAFDKGALSSNEHESQSRKLLNGRMCTTTATPALASASTSLANNTNMTISSSQTNRRNSATIDTITSNTSSGGVHKFENKNVGIDGPTKSVLQTQYPNVLSSNQAHVIQLPTAPYAPSYANGK